MKKIIATTLALAAPAVTLAQVQVHDANSLITAFTNFSQTAVFVLIGIAVIYIIWNALQFIRFGGDSDKRGEYQSAIVYGIIGLAVILSIWGLVAILKNTFMTEDTQGQINANANLHNLILRK
ncbi:MAG TPA: hypothetical protein VF438_00370 [Candidatus Paceibacterota bacterium]